MPLGKRRFVYFVFFFCIWKNVREKNHSLPSISAKAQATQRFNNGTLQRHQSVEGFGREPFVCAFNIKTLQRPKVMFVVPTFVMIHPLLRNQLPREITRCPLSVFLLGSMICKAKFVPTPKWRILNLTRDSHRV